MESGHIAAARLDVIDGEWLPDKNRHPLSAYSRRKPRLAITPHVGGACPESLRVATRHTFQKLVNFLREHPTDQSHR